jgi:hypothetical protein
MNEEQNKIPLPEEQPVTPPTPPKPDFLQGDDWFDVDISGDFLDFDKPYRPPRYTMEREGVPFADVGEIHIVSGKPGNGKTGLMAQLIAAALGGRFGNTIARRVGHKVNGSDIFHELPTRILYVDTEQGEDDTIGFKNRVISMSGVSKEDAKEHLNILRLRDTELAKDRWRKILKAIWQMQPTDIFLDGMLDIVEDYNDQKECQPIIRKCMMMATHYDASLWAVLHENPMVDKLVGTLGSITQRKVSEIFTVIKVKQADLKQNERRDDLPDIYFRVKQNKARGRDVKDWLFQYVTNAGGWGQPVEIEDNGQRIVDTKEMELMKEADALFKSYNWTSTGATYTDLERYVRSKGVTSNRKISTLFNTAMESGIIYKSDRKKYHYKGLNAVATNDQAEDLPFDKPDGEQAPY